MIIKLSKMDVKKLSLLSCKLKVLLHSGINLFVDMSNKWERDIERWTFQEGEGKDRK